MPLPILLALVLLATSPRRSTIPPSAGASATPGPAGWSQVAERRGGAVALAYAARRHWLRCQRRVHGRRDRHLRPRDRRALVAGDLCRGRPRRLASLSAARQQPGGGLRWSRGFGARLCRAAIRSARLRNTRGHWPAAARLRLWRARAAARRKRPRTHRPHLRSACPSHLSACRCWWLLWPHSASSDPCCISIRCCCSWPACWRSPRAWWW